MCIINNIVDDKLIFQRPKLAKNKDLRNILIIKTPYYNINEIEDTIWRDNEKLLIMSNCVTFNFSKFIVIDNQSNLYISLKLKHDFPRSQNSLF